MIAVELLSGDLSIGAEGTVTAVDGKAIYAFGHQFMSVGNTELPFARAEVLTLLPNLSSSFKISSPLEWMGSITEDRSTSIYGELGRKANTVPLEITVKDGRRAPLSYHMQMIQDRVLSPYIVQTAVYSAMDATERTLGPRQLFAARRGGIRARRSAAEARQHLRRRFQRAAAGVHRRRLAAGVDSGRRFRRAEDQEHHARNRSLRAQAAAAGGSGDCLAQASSSGRFGRAERHVYRRERPGNAEERPLSRARGRAGRHVELHRLRRLHDERCSISR